MRKKKEEEFKVEVTQTLEPHELKKTVYFGYNTRLLLNILICISFLGVVMIRFMIPISPL